MCIRDRFHWLPSTEPEHKDFMDYNFDGGLEFNHPKDTFWSDGGGDAEEEPNLTDHLGTGDKYDKMYKATDRMMSFVYRCVTETPAGRNMVYSTESHSFEGVDYEDDGDKFPTACLLYTSVRADGQHRKPAPAEPYIHCGHGGRAAPYRHSGRCEGQEPVSYTHLSQWSRLYSSTATANSSSASR